MKITHDFHIHTGLSVCADKDATVEHYIAKAKELGLKKIGFSNHFWQSELEGAVDFYRTQDYAHVAQIKPELEQYRDCGVELFYGCECEYHPSLGVAMTAETAEKFDYILVPSSHTHAMMPKQFYHPYEKHRDFMIKMYEDILHSAVSNYITAMAHPFEAVCCPYDNTILIKMIDDDTFKRLFDQTAEKGIAVEINVYAMNGKTHTEIEQSEQMRMFRIAKECGCKFIFGSDSHTRTGHDCYSNCDDIAEILHLTEDDLAAIAR